MFKNVATLPAPPSPPPAILRSGWLDLNSHQTGLSILKEIRNQRHL